MTSKKEVPYCPLFEGRPFQYGPACACALGQQKMLVYYPLGSGKTLAALHAASVFMEKTPDRLCHCHDTTS